MDQKAKKTYIVGKASTKTEVIRTTIIEKAQGCVEGLCWMFSVIGSNSVAPYAIYTKEEWDALR